MEKLLLVDGMALVHRGYYGIKAERYTGEGEQTNALFGFATMLLTAIEREKPSHVALAFEGGKTYRHELFPGYKANRKETPEDLTAQLPRIFELAEILGIPVYFHEGCEADDIIGILSHQAPGPVAVITGDKDLLQLVTPMVKVCLPSSGPGARFADMKAYWLDDVKEKYGFGPELIPDFKALAGDPSDGIPGLPGVGPKGAGRLIAKYGTVEKMVEALVTMKNFKLLEGMPNEEVRFINFHKEAQLFKKITTIMRELPPGFPGPGVSLDLAAPRFGQFDINTALAWFETFLMEPLRVKLINVHRQAPTYSPGRQAARFICLQTGLKIQKRKGN
jgi:DNA polymerase-1